MQNKIKLSLVISCLIFNIAGCDKQNPKHSNPHVNEALMHIKKDLWLSEKMNGIEITLIDNLHVKGVGLANCAAPDGQIHIRTEYVAEHGTKATLSCILHELAHIIHGHMGQSDEQEKIAQDFMNQWIKKLMPKTTN